MDKEFFKVDFVDRKDVTVTFFSMGDTFSGHMEGTYHTSSEHILEDIVESIRKVQFHPSYDYTDFVEGIRPMEDKSFKRVDGEFKEFCVTHRLERGHCTGQTQLYHG